MTYADAYDFVVKSGLRATVEIDTEDDDCSRRPVRFCANRGTTLYEGPWGSIDDLHESAEAVVDQIKKAAA